jgi:ribokinase
VTAAKMRYRAGDRPRRRGQQVEDRLPRRHHDHAIESLRAALKSLRTRSGLTVDRLRATELTIGPLLDLDVVRRVGRAQQLSPEEAIVAVVRGAAAQLDVADMLIVDAALALGLVAESFPDGPDLSGLYAPDLSERREFVVAQWATLHEVVGAPKATRAPTVRALRTELESRAFERLGERILTASPLDAPPDGRPALVAPSTRTGPESAAKARAANGTAPRVVVVGAAVMDHIHAVDHVPELGTSIQATSYQFQPGGKGLNQAVAAARLGMDAHLITTLGDDDAGQRVLAYLQNEGVNTDFVRVVSGATTPVTTVLIAPDGSTSTIGWMNQEQLGVTVRDVQSRAFKVALDDADSVLLTFTVAGDTIEAVLEATARAARQPVVLLRPSPPYNGPRFAHESLRYVDYLLGTRWELRGLLPASSGEMRPDRLSRQLLVLGAGTVCVAEKFGCMVRSNDLAFDVPPVFTAFKEAPGARDAFAAALALRLHESDGQLGEADAAWATAAMSASSAFGGVASSMPTRDEVDRILRLGSGLSGTEDHDHSER